MAGKNENKQLLGAVVSLNKFGYVRVAEGRNVIHIWRPLHSSTWLDGGKEVGTGRLHAELYTSYASPHQPLSVLKNALQMK
jgi:hypothetical protein